MSETMDVTARLRGDNASFDSAQKRSAEVAESTSSALQRAAKKAADAQAFASKFAGDSVDRQSVRMVQALVKQHIAQQEYARIQGIAKAGYLGEAEAAKVTAAALQRLTEAREAANRAQSHTHNYASVRESIGGLRFGEAFDQVKMFAGVALLAELANKMREAVQESLEFAEAMQRASEKTGLGVQTLSMLHYAASVTGGDFDGMTAAITKMDRTIAQATQGNKQAEAFMKSLGLNAQELAGRSDGAEIAFRKFASTLAATENPIRRVELATGLLGRAGAEQIPTLIQLGQNWDAFSQQAQSAGRMLDGPTAAALTGLQERLKRMQQAIAGAGLSFTEGLAPGLSRVLDVIASGRSSMDTMQAWGRDTSKAIALVAEVAYSAASALEYMFGAAELGKMTEAGRRDMAAAKLLQQQAQQFHDIAFAKGVLQAPKPLIAEPKTKGGNTGFEGIGDQHTPKASNAAEAQMKSFEDILNRRKQDEQLSVVDEINFWEAMLAPAAKYPENLRRIYATLGSLTQEYYRQLDQSASKAVEAQKRAAEQLKQQDAQMLSMMKQWEEQDSRRATSQAKLAEAQQRSADAIAEQALQFQVMTGQLSRHDAALQRAAIHAADFRAQLEELDREQAEDAQRSTLSADERETRANNRAIRRVEITGEMNRTAAADQQQIDNTTALGASTDALREFTASALDSSRQIHEFIASTLNTVNDAILSGKKGSFRQAGGQILKTGARSFLEEGEGHLMKALGISDPNKKPKGTASDPLYVVNARNQAQGSLQSANSLMKLFSGGGSDNADGLSSAISGGASQTMGGIMGLLQGMGGSTAVADTVATAVGGGADAGAGIGEFLSGLGDLAFFADGTGPLTADTMAMVGERGPEIVNLPRGSSVTPNHQLPNLGHTFNIPIDARGSTDPAQTVAQVHRAIQSYIPGIVSASVQATHAQRARMPRMNGN